MIINIKERPRCRKKIMQIRERENSTLKGLWDNRYTKTFFPSDGLKKQLKKMLLEAGFNLSDLK